MRAILCTAVILASASAFHLPILHTAQAAHSLSGFNKVKSSSERKVSVVGLDRILKPCHNSFTSATAIHSSALYAIPIKPIANNARYAPILHVPYLKFCRIAQMSNILVDMHFVNVILTS